MGGTIRILLSLMFTVLNFDEVFTDSVLKEDPQQVINN